MLRYVELKGKPKEFLAATGLTDEEFQILLPTFEKCYQLSTKPKPKVAKKKKQRAKGGGRKAKLPEVSDKLLFVLIYQKTAQLQTLHGLQFGLSQPQTNYWIHRLLPALQQTLRDLGMKPERDGQKVSQTIEAREGGANLSLDATERELQRPVNSEKQTANYSGKKKTHTDKNLLLINENTKKVVYLSATVEGKKHDKKLADESHISYPENASMGARYWFSRLSAKRRSGAATQKKVRGEQLTAIDKFFNKIISRVRIVVENVISGVKRCRIVKDKLRLTKENISDVVMEIACGLHNLRVTFRQPMQTIDITDDKELSYFR